MSTSIFPPLLLLALSGVPSAAPLPGQDDDVISQEQLEGLTAEIKADIAKLREKEFLRDVPVALEDAEGLRAFAKADFEKSMTPTEMAAEETVAKMLGLIPPDMDLLETSLKLLEEQVGGFYDPDTEGFYLMERFSGAATKIILAHELTHALDDQLYDLDGKIEARHGNTDAQLAFMAVAEGSGTAVMSAWSTPRLMKGELDMKAVMDADSMSGDELLETPPYIWKPLLFRYVRGQAFLNRTENLLTAQMKLPALDDFDTAFTNPPRSSEQILHPEKYWDAESPDEPLEVTFQLGELPEGWSVLQEQTLGEVGLGLVVEPPSERKGLDPKNPLAVMATKYTSEASEGWGGDRYVLFGRGDARILYSETAWDSERDADEFLAAMNEVQEHVRSSLAETARLRGLAGSGLEVARGEDGPTVGILAWLGVDDATLGAVREVLHATSAPKLR